MELRSYDVMVFHGEQATVPQRISLVERGEARLITGIRKLAQRVLWLLLTRRGSVLGQPELGTFLLTEARRGQWRTIADVQDSFASARFDLLRQLRDLESDDDPPDERIEDVQLERVVLRHDSAALHLRLVSQAGEEREVLMPVPERNPS